MTDKNEASPAQRTSTIYIADSDAAVRDGIQFLLETKNLMVTAFSDGKTMLDLVLAAPPDCIITQVVFPDITGIILLQLIGEQGLRVPVIMLANTSDISIAVDAVKAGAWDYFEKPIIQRVLLDSVERAIRHGELGR